MDLGGGGSRYQDVSECTRSQGNMAGSFLEPTKQGRFVTATTLQQSSASWRPRPSRIWRCCLLSTTTAAETSERPATRVDIEPRMT